MLMRKQKPKESKNFRLNSRCAKQDSQSRDYFIILCIPKKWEYFSIQISMH